MMGKALCKNFSIGTILLLLTSNAMATEVDDLAKKVKIKLTDERNSSKLIQSGAIVGCDDTLNIDELKCSKERESDTTTLILNKLPTQNEDLQDIKEQLSSIVKELSELKKQKESNIRIKEQLVHLIEDISKEESHSSEQRLSMLKKSITELVDLDEKSKVKKKKSSVKKEGIKEIAVKSDHVIIEVQQGESLSKYAHKYYHDNRKYYRIYRANTDKIGKDLQIFVGDKLIIPTSDTFKFKEEIKKVEVKSPPKVKKVIIEKKIEEKAKNPEQIILEEEQEVEKSINIEDDFEDNKTYTIKVDEVLIIDEEEENKNIPKKIIDDNDEEEEENKVKKVVKPLDEVVVDEIIIDEEGESNLKKDFKDQPEFLNIQ